MKRFLRGAVVAALAGAALCHFVILPVAAVLLLPDDIRLSAREFAEKMSIEPAPFVRGVYCDAVTVDDTAEQYIDLKLFGIIPIKRVKVDILPFERVIAGGMPIGFTAKVSGAIVLNDALGLRRGDVITAVNSVAVTSIKDLDGILATAQGAEIEVAFARGGINHTVTVENTGARIDQSESIWRGERSRETVQNTEFLRSERVELLSAENIRESGQRGLGLWLKDETSGIGMLTYINPENNNFAALGHRLVDHETGASADAVTGDVFMCSVLGIERGSGHRVGELQSTLKQGSEEVQGSVLSGNARGIYGCLNADSTLLRLCCANDFPVASRYFARPGKAEILLSLDGEKIDRYEIEIIKTRYQKHEQDKGIILRITDARLLAQTGGIIHGMSGSPIIQNGKMVGALTHVMMGDVTKGYGVYLDFILP